MKVWRFVGISLLHFIVQLVVGATVFAMSMGRFDTGAPASFVERVLDILMNVLWLPLALPLVKVLHWNRGFPLEYIPFMLNSIVWGILLSWSWARWKARRSA